MTAFQQLDLASHRMSFQPDTFSSFAVYRWCIYYYCYFTIKLLLCKSIHTSSLSAVRKQPFN